jgi:hypothetical protein
MMGDVKLNAIVAPRETRFKATRGTKESGRRQEGSLVTAGFSVGVHESVRCVGADVGKCSPDRRSVLRAVILVVFDAKDWCARENIVKRVQSCKPAVPCTPSNV